LSNEHLFGIADLARSEALVLGQTEAEAEAIVRNYPGIIDTMLNFPYYWGELPAPETEEGLFSLFASSHFLQIPYTAWSLFDIWRRGYYLESSILLRSLLEILIQLRYFQCRPSVLEAHLHPEKGNVQFKTMFETIAPGYYKKILRPSLRVCAR
jgi:hypothetical protein